MKKIIFTIMAFLLGFSSLFAEITVTGKITNEKGEQLIGVVVAVKGTSYGTVSRSGGVFKLQLTKAPKTLVLKLVGMKTKEVEVGGKTELNISMEEDAIMTDVVVVTAIGMEREKKSLGYSIEEIKGKQISDAKAPDLINSLSGKLAGVTVTNSSGTPGSSAFITIRGITSITGNNQPLFVIDGVPIDNSMNMGGNPDNSSNNLLEGVAQSNRAIDINPDDVDAISVLKGPAATALYGIRAASGAIIITTKKGTYSGDDKINVSYFSSLQFDQVNKLPELQDKFSQGTGGAISQPGGSQRYSWGAAIDTLRYSATANKFDKNGSIVSMNDPTATSKAVKPYDNVGNFFGVGQTYNNSISMSGATENSGYYFSLGDMRSTGVVPNSSFERTSVRFNGESQISSWLKASATANYIKSGGVRIQQGSNTSGVMLGLLRTPVTFDITNGFGHDALNNPEAYSFSYLDRTTQRTYRGESAPGKTIYDNPFWTVNKNPFTDNVDRLIGSAQLNSFLFNYNDNDDFTLSGDAMLRLGADYYVDSRTQVFAIASASFPSGRIFNQDITSNDYNGDLIVNFNSTVNKINKLKLALGYNLFQSGGTSLFTQGDGFVVPDFYHMSNTSSQIIRQGESRLRRSAVYGDLTYSLNDWLYLNGTMRNEKSTTLPEKNNSFTFGSGNMSLIFTDMDALKDIFKKSILNQGKLRVNYAVVGKDAPLYGTITAYSQAVYTDGWTGGVSFPYNGTVGYSMSDVLANPDLKPEMTKSYEVGLGLNFLDNMIGLDITYYNSLSSNQIWSVPIASTSGYSRQFLNAGEISNKGFEILFNITPIKTDEFKWNMAVNFAKNNNMVESLAPGIDNLFLGGFTGTSVRAVAGKPFGTIFGPGWARDAQGNLIINTDPNAGPVGYPVLDTKEKDWGSFNPDWTMGIMNNFAYAGFTLSFLIDIRQGGKMWNGTRGALTTFGMDAGTATRDAETTFKGYYGKLDIHGNVVYTDQSGKEVSSAQQNTSVVKLNQSWYSGQGGGFSNNTEDFVEDASWVRLREISLSYRLPKEILSYLYAFSDLSLTFTGRNLWLSTKYKGVDPETSLMGSNNAQGIDYFNMPGIKSYIFTISVKL